MDDDTFRDQNHHAFWFSRACEFRSSADDLWSSAQRRFSGSQKVFDGAMAGDPASVRSFHDARFQGDMVRLAGDSRVTQLIAGYALELAAKALLIQAKPHVVANGDAKLGHKIADIASDAGFTLTAEEQDCCVFFSDIVLDAGRYPSAKDKRSSINGVGYYWDWFAQFAQLFDRMKLAYDERCGVKASGLFNL